MRRICQMLFLKSPPKFFASFFGRLYHAGFALDKKIFYRTKKNHPKIFSSENLSAKFLRFKIIVGSFDVRVARGRHHVELVKRHLLVYRAAAKFQTQKETVLDLAQLREVRLRKSLVDCHFNHVPKFFSVFILYVARRILLHV